MPVPQIENVTAGTYAVSVTDVDEFNCGKPRSPHRIAILITVAVATVVAVVALGALVVARTLSSASSAPRSFDHSVWVAHHGPREAMLTDLLRHTICPGTTYRRAIELLGRPDSTIPYPGQAPTVEYDVGSFGMFYVQFTRGSRGTVVYQVMPPPSADAWPDTGCWA